MKNNEGDEVEIVCLLILMACACWMFFGWLDRESEWIGAALIISGFVSVVWISWWFAFPLQIEQSMVTTNVLTINRKVVRFDRPVTVTINSQSRFLSVRDHVTYEIKVGE